MYHKIIKRGVYSILESLKDYLCLRGYIVSKEAEWVYAEGSYTHVGRSSSRSNSSSLSISSSISLMGTSFCKNLFLHLLLCTNVCKACSFLAIDHGSQVCDPSISHSTLNSIILREEELLNDLGLKSSMDLTTQKWSSLTAYF